MFARRPTRIQYSRIDSCDMRGCAEKQRHGRRRLISRFLWIERLAREPSDSRSGVADESNGEGEEGEQFPNQGGKASVLAEWSGWNQRVTRRM